MAAAKSTENHSTSNFNTRRTGQRGEDFAVRFLNKKGYRVIERNYRCIFGEIDLIARDKDEIVFVEVKSRRSKDFGAPEAAVDTRKQKKISRIAMNYLQEEGLYDSNARFDVVAIHFLPEGERVEIIKNAFDLIS